MSKLILLGLLVSLIMMLQTHADAIQNNSLECKEEDADCEEVLICEDEETDVNANATVPAASPAYPSSPPAYPTPATPVSPNSPASNPESPVSPVSPSTPSDAAPTSPETPPTTPVDPSIPDTPKQHQDDSDMPCPATPMPCPDTPAPCPIKPDAISETCTLVSVYGDATYCIEGITSDQFTCESTGEDPENNRCPKKGAITGMDCSPLSPSYNAETGKCILNYDSVCMELPNGRTGCGKSDAADSNKKVESAASTISAAPLALFITLLALAM